MNKLREETATSDAVIKQKQADDGPKAAYGYGGKFGVQADRYFQFYGDDLLDLQMTFGENWPV